MKNNKTIFMSLFMLISLPGLSFNNAYAQCCNVYTSNGSIVLASNGACASLSYPTSVCTQTYVETITIKVWTIVYTALEEVYFASNSDVLTPSSYPALDKVVNVMKNDNYNLKISGYADSTGTDQYNKDLSKKRANAVKQYLTENGVSKKRITVAAYGEKMPEAPNGTQSGRAMNRRVTFDLY
jgi:outer membrane protein OmpA-like peptidoglycan-associated protein